jgi:hypothetical protein
MTELVDEVRTVTGQLEPERARLCRNAIATGSVMVDEIRLPDCTPGALTGVVIAALLAWGVGD